MTQPLLAVHGLEVHFDTPEGTARAVEGVSLELAPGETLGMVGESGCGKSVTALSIMGLIPSPPGRVAGGRIVFDSRELLTMDTEALRRVRGRDIAMIFQEPMTSLNPVLTIGRQVAEPLRVHMGLNRAEARSQAQEWLDRMKIPAAGSRLNDFPHQLSGGMRQRVMIAMAMACRPRLIIADEPTTALDVTIQAQVLSLMAELQHELGTALLLITHDLGVIAQMVTRVMVMYAGQIVEAAPVEDLFDRPFHPYTQGLLKSMPRLDAHVHGGRPRLTEIKGTVPRLTEQIKGCKFAPRCLHTFDLCREKAPDFFPVARGRNARCWLKPHHQERACHG